MQGGMADDAGSATDKRSANAMIAVRYVLPAIIALVGVMS